MMTADGRVQGGCGLSFDASPPDIFLVLNLGRERFGRFGRFRRDGGEFRRDNPC